MWINAGHPPLPPHRAQTLISINYDPELLFLGAISSSAQGCSQGARSELALLYARQEPHPLYYPSGPRSRMF